MSAAFLVLALIQFALGLVVAWMIGPAAFGLYALALAAAMLVQTLLFDWLRLGITRFAGEGDPDFLRRLKRGVIGMSAFCLALVLTGALFGAEKRLFWALIPLVALVSGLSDLIAARLRAAFAQKDYALLSLFRAVFGLILLPMATHAVPTAEAALAAYGGAMVLATAAFALFRRGRAGAVPGAQDDVATAPVSPDLRGILAYSWPIILTNLAYLALFFALRALVARDFGLAASGQFSLALDFGLKLVMTLGTALDVYLFQVAVREAREKGPERANLRLAYNAEMVLLALAVMLAGTWLLLPSIEVLIIAPGYRQAFSLWFLALAPGLLLYGFVQYALHPFRQIAAETTPIAFAGLFALVVAFAVIALGGAALKTRPEMLIGVSLGAGMVAAAVSLLIRTGSPLHRPMIALSRSALVVVATIGFGSIGARAFEPGLSALGATMLAGAFGALGHAWLFNAGFLRSIIARRQLPPV